MLDDRRIKLLLILIMFLLICAIVIIYENRAQDDPLENWKGGSIPIRPDEYKPHPKVFHEKNETTAKQQKGVIIDDPLENWKGRWMPSRLGEYTPPPKILHEMNSTQQLFFLSNDHTRYINAGEDYVCDDGVNNLAVDWDHSSTSYTCFGRKIIPDSSTIPDYFCDTVPINYKVMHKCTSEVIEFAQDIPTFGTSRPVWPAYGEYKYVPVQRWLHSLEHGAIVMLYHPCANTLEVEHLKELIKKCLRRHVISPNNSLDEKTPLALLSWGCKLSMSYVDESLVKQFIRENALRGPKERYEDGNYVDQLMEKAKLVSGDQDSNLCPESTKSNVTDKSRR